MLRPRLSWLLVLVPVSVVAELVVHNELLVFVTSAAAILPLAGVLGRATEELALHVGPRTGGLLNATFGNLTELIIAVFLVLRGEFDVVKASLIGSILGNILLVLGLSFFLGGLRYREQDFNERSASVHATSLMLAVLGLVMPALFALDPSHTFAENETVSLVVAGVLILLYAGALLFTLRTHEHLFRTPEADEKPSWTRTRALGVLVVAAGFVALMSEFLVGALDPAVESLGVSKFFVGIILVPLVGNAAEHGAAVLFAMKNKMDISLEIAIGSSTQIALFVAPALVFISLATGHPMTFVFRVSEVAAVATAAVIMNLIALDGKSNWLEGAQLVGAYVIMAIAFFFVT
jgi:Ca2+:H+ antiporter